MKKPKLLLFAQLITFLVCLLIFIISLVGYFSLNSTTSNTSIQSLEEDSVSAEAASEDSLGEDISEVEDSSPPTPTEIAEKIRKSVRKGQVAFNTPEKMSVGDTEEIEVKITDNLDKKLNIETEKGQKVERDNIDISHIMTAELAGSGFNIKALQKDDVFLVLKDRVVVWRWAVTPNKTGKQKLLLKINAKLKFDDFKTTVNLQEFERTIEVQVNPGNWFQKNWLKIVEIFLVIFGSGIVAYIASKLTVMKKLAEKINSWVKSTLPRLKKK